MFTVGDHVCFTRAATPLAGEVLSVAGEMVKVDVGGVARSATQSELRFSSIIDAMSRRLAIVSDTGYRRLGEKFCLQIYIGQEERRQLRLEMNNRYVMVNDPKHQDGQPIFDGAKVFYVTNDRHFEAVIIPQP